MIAGTTAAVVSSAVNDQPDVVVVNQASTAIGTVAYVLPAGCAKVIRNNITYYNCNNVWYQPQYQSSGVTYLIVAPPP